MALEGDVLRVVAQLSLGVGVTVQNVYHLQVRSATGANDEVIPDDMGEYLEDVYSEFLDRIPTTAAFDEYSVQNITVDVDLGTWAWPTLTNGNAGVEPNAPGVAALARARTLTPGHEGRKFFGPLSEGATQDGWISPGGVTDLSDTAEAAYGPFSALSGVQYQPVVYDREHDTVRDPIETVVTNNPAYQRRRRAGRGI